MTTPTPETTSETTPETTPITDLITGSDLRPPPGTAHILVLGLSPGLGVTTTAAWLARTTAPPGAPPPPPLITDAGFLADHSRRGLAQLLHRSCRTNGQLADMLVLLRHAGTPPGHTSTLLDAAKTIYAAAGQPAPHRVIRTRGCGDRADLDMAARTRLTNRLLLTLAAQIFAPGSPDFAAAQTAFAPDESPAP